MGTEIQGMCTEIQGLGTEIQGMGTENNIEVSLTSYPWLGQ